MPTRPRNGLAAVLIVRNEARCLERCLASLRPWVDHCLVLDTGSTDNTLAIARASGAEVHETKWPDSFALARNQALELANADWNLIIDADEWLDRGGAALRGWCAGKPRLGRVCVESTYDQGGGGVATEISWITRIIPRGVRYEGRVHEQVASALPRLPLDVVLGHDGYRDAQRARKRRRNRTLLLRDLADQPDDPYLLFQLGTEDEGDGDFAAAGARYAASLALTPVDANWRHGLVVRYLHCLGRSGCGEAAVLIASRIIDEWAHSPDFHFVVGNLALDRAIVEPEHALEGWLPLAAASWERCLELGEQPQLEGSVHGRGSHLARHNLDVLYHETGAAPRA